MRSMSLRPIKSCLPGYDAYQSKTPYCNIRIIRRSLHLEPITPRFHVQGHSVYCNDVALDLSKRPMTLKLIKTYCAEPERKFSRDDLVKIIYASFNPEEKSERFNEVLRQNITKLISRARLSMDGAYNQVRPWIEFFTYDPIKENWNFYRLKNEYIVEKEAKLYSMYLRR